MAASRPCCGANGWRVPNIVCGLRNFVIHGGALGNGSNVGFRVGRQCRSQTAHPHRDLRPRLQIWRSVVSDQAAAFAYDATSAASWNGLYAGLGLGARVSQSEMTTTSPIFSTPFDLTGAALSRSFDGTASRGNPYLGFNWQFMPRWVAGIEGDVGIVNQSTTQSGFFTPFFQSFAPSDSVSLKTTWDASLRGRIGLLLSPATMAYITSGVAWQHYEVNTTCASFSCTLNGLAPALVSVSTTKVGLDDWRRS